MIHAKVLIVDGVWSVIGSVNLDSRSFGINDEVSVAARDSGLADRLEEDFIGDLKVARSVSYSQWRRRPVLERANEWLGWLIEKQE
jgi:cardiolipin synthase